MNKAILVIITYLFGAFPLLAQVYQVDYRRLVSQKEYWCRENIINIMMSKSAKDSEYSYLLNNAIKHNEIVPVFQAIVKENENVDKDQIVFDIVQDDFPLDVCFVKGNKVKLLANIEEEVYLHEDFVISSINLKSMMKRHFRYILRQQPDLIFYCADFFGCFFYVKDNVVYVCDYAHNERSPILKYSRLCEYSTTLEMDWDFTSEPPYSQVTHVDFQSLVLQKDCWNREKIVKELLPRAEERFLVPSSSMSLIYSAINNYEVVPVFQAMVKDNGDNKNKIQFDIEQNGFPLSVYFIDKDEFKCMINTYEGNVFYIDKSFSSLMIGHGRKMRQSFHYILKQQPVLIFECKDFYGCYFYVKDDVVYVCDYFHEEVKPLLKYSRLNELKKTAEVNRGFTPK